MAKQRDKTPAGRLYPKRTRWYADFRDFADVGGKQEAMIPDGDRSATEDRDVAERLAGDRLKELQEAKRAKDLTGVQPERLEAYAAYHMDHKRRETNSNGKPFSDRYLHTFQKHLDDAVEFFRKPDGGTPFLGTIRAPHVQKWVNHLRQQDNGRGGTLSDATIREYINAVSNLYKRAISEGLVEHNPVGDMFSKPTPTRAEAHWLEVEDAALYLEAARQPLTYGPAFMHALIATFLLTGARKSEIFGLRVEDVSLDTGRIHIRENEHRGLKTKNAARSVPIFTHLEQILREYLYGGDTPRVSGLLFPSHTGGMLTSVDKSLDAIGERIGWEPKRVRLHALRHTYATFRLQTLDHGAPVSMWTVAGELGHRDTGLIKERYGHLGERPVRLVEPDYRPETLRQWWEDIAAQYKADAARARERDPNRARAAERQAQQVRESAEAFADRLVKVA